MGSLGSACRIRDNDLCLAREVITADAAEAEFFPPPAIAITKRADTCGRSEGISRITVKKLLERE